jgi:hypothetical protein
MIKIDQGKPHKGGNIYRSRKKENYSPHTIKKMGFD